MGNSRYRFRAWDKENRRMYNKGIGIFPCECKYPMSISSDGIFIRPGYEKFVLMQYTGLKDKSGREIFEGDIIKVPDDWDMFGSNAGEVYGVYFNYGGFRFKPKYNSESKGYWLEDGGVFEVIGNIYESNIEELCQ